MSFTPNTVPRAQGSKTALKPRGAAPEASAKPAISVIVCCYNAEETLAAALASLLAQSCPDWEAICVDDGSTDGTPQQLALFAQRDPRIRFLRSAHRGLPAARNRGISEARGHYVLFFDADDLLRPEALAVWLRCARQTDGQSILAAGYELLDENAFPLGVYQFPTLKNFTINAFIRGEQFGVSTALVPLRLLGKRPFNEDLPAFIDYDLWLRLAKRGARAQAIPRVLTGYRLRSKSMSHKARVVYSCSRRVFQHWLPGTPPQEAQQALLRLAITYGAMAAAAGDAQAVDEFLQDLLPISALDETAAEQLAWSIHFAFAHYRGAVGLTWQDGGQVWVNEVRTWLGGSALSAHAGLIASALEQIAATPRDYLATVRPFLSGRGDLSRLVIYGLGQNGAALLEQLRAALPALPGELCLADDNAAPIAFTAQGLPHVDPRRWRTWPPRTAVIVTPNDSAAMEATLRSAGGRPDVDFLSLAAAARHLSAAAC